MKRIDFIILLMIFAVTTLALYLLNVYSFGYSIDESLKRSLAFFIGQVIGCITTEVIYRLWIKFGFGKK